MDCLTHFGSDSSSRTKQQQRGRGPLPAARQFPNGGSACCKTKMTERKEGNCGAARKTAVFLSRLLALRRPPSSRLPGRNNNARSRSVRMLLLIQFCPSHVVAGATAGAPRRGSTKGWWRVDRSLAARKGGWLAHPPADAEGHRLYPARRIAECFDEMARGRLLI